MVNFKVYIIINLLKDRTHFLFSNLTFLCNLKIFFIWTGNFMEMIDIHSATDREKDMAACLLETSDPWITLGITSDQCRKNCHDPEFMLYMAYSNNSRQGSYCLTTRDCRIAIYKINCGVSRIPKSGNRHKTSFVRRGSFQEWFKTHIHLCIVI